MEKKQGHKLRDLIYVDEKLLDKFVEQIRDSFAEVDKKSWKMSASLAGPLIESARTTERVPLKSHEKIQLIEVFLEANNDLLMQRPVTAKELDHKDAPRFVSESMSATKVMLPLSGGGAIGGLSSVAIWVSDPDPLLYVHEPYVWRGTFLYLSELHWERGTREHFLSGISALQVIVNLSQGKDFFEFVRDEFEPFGRGRDLHPVDKLKELGGIVIDKRRVKSLYRVRYITNEQVYNFDGDKRRVNDLFGYPLYIEDHS